MLIILSQIVCLLVIAVAMVAYSVGRLIYVLMPSFNWTSSSVRQISKVTGVSKGIVEKS